MNMDSVPKRSLQLLIGLVLALATAVTFSTSIWQPAAHSVQAAPMHQDTPLISFVQSTTSVIEPDNGETTDLVINVKINQAPVEGQQATVMFTTVNGGATAGIDYEAASGTLTFPVGSIENQKITIKIIGNNADDGDRNFVVSLTNPVNAATTSPANITVTIVDDDEAPTSTPTANPTSDIYLDNYEPNNSFDTAYTTSADAANLTGITLWPAGDQDYFQFYGQQGLAYEVFTTNLTAGLDTLLKVYDPNGNKIGENDNFDPPNLSSQFSFTANTDGFYFARVLNQDPTNPTNRTYSFGVTRMNPPTATPTATQVGQPDSCENNNSLDLACLIGTDEIKQSMNFVPPVGTSTDNDFYRLAVKVGVLYTCETTDLSAITDTNMIFYDNYGNDFNPPLGNDDREPGVKSSLLSWLATYNGNLYILVGPVNPPPYADTPTTRYNLVCRGVAATPTPIPTATTAFVPTSTGGGTGGTGGFVPTSTPFVFPTFPPTPTPIDLSSLATPTPAPPPIVDFVPLPTSTPPASTQQTTSVQVTIYYDSNLNFTPELNEGVMDVAVELYDNATGELIAFGYTNEAGVVRFDSISSSGAVRVEVAYLSYSQVVTGASANILLRIEPRPLPGDIP